VAWLCCAGCGSQDPGTPAAEPVRDASEPLEIYVVNHPLQYLAERIGGRSVRVTLPAPPGADPADWLPDAETVLAYGDADLILLNGAGYARWLALASLPRDRLLDTSARFEDRFVERHGTTTHVHGKAGTHSHEGFESTTWLDPELALLQARAIAEALGGLRPEASATFQQNLTALERDLLALDARLAAAAQRIGDLPLLFSHPVYGYLIRRYGLNARSVHFEPDELPDRAAWQGLAVLLEEHPARVMLWEHTPLPETAARLRELGIESVVFDPCGGVPATGDFLDVMNANAARLESIGAELASS
jgi:zinc transport system substrate-binding protein